MPVCTLAVLLLAYPGQQLSTHTAAGSLPPPQQWGEQEQEWEDLWAGIRQSWEGKVTQGNHHSPQADPCSISKQPPWKTTLSHLLLCSSMPVFYCWQWYYRQWNTPLAGFGQLSLLCLAGGKHTIILPEWNLLPHTYVMFVWVVSLLIGEHRHLFDSAVLFEGIGFSREGQDGLIIRGQTWETQLSQVVNEEIELRGNTSQTGFDQSRKRKRQNT